MPIPLKDSANPKPLRVYLLSEKDYKVINNTFDKLYD